MNNRKSLTAFFCILFFSCSLLFANEDSLTYSLTSDPKDMDSVGLVLCGSSVRAYSHIGVLRALEKADIKPDFIVANSVGAIIGILYASGFSPDDIEMIVSKADLTSFYRTVKPDLSGNLYSQYFDAFISDLFNGESFDIKDTAIPIIIPTLDTVTKRQTVYTEGNISDIMRMIFAMSYMMEPVNVSQNDRMVVHLEDSNDLDILSLNIAEHYSHNLIVSTASYSPKMNMTRSVKFISNPLANAQNQNIQNRLFASPYAWIRTDLEDISFNNHSDISNIIVIGEATTSFYLETHPSPYTGSLSKFLNDKPGFEFMRKLRHSGVDEACTSISKQLELYLKTLNEHPEDTENAPYVEMNDFYFSEKFSEGLYTFYDFRAFYIRTGIRTNFYTFWGPDNNLLPKIKTILFSDFSSFSLSDSVISEISEQDIILGLENKKTFHFQNFFSIRPYITGEMVFHFEKNEELEQKYLLRGGLEFYNRNHQTYSYIFNPFIYCFEEELNNNPIHNIGYGGKLSMDSFTSANIGLKFSESFRYQTNGKGIALNKNDSYRGNCPSDKPEQTKSTYLNLTQMEAFWFFREKPLKATNNIKIEKVRMGIYYDLLSFSQTLEHTFGIFMRPQIILYNKSLLNLELYTGYDTSESSPVFGFFFTQNW